MKATTRPHQAAHTNEIIVASWNLLYDDPADNLPMQSERLNDHVDAINNIQDGSSPDILYCCEGASHENLHQLACKTGLQIVGESHSYGDNQVMAFMARPDIADIAKSEYYEHGSRSRRYGFMIMSAADITYIGAHSDDKAVRGMLWRSRASHSMRQILNPAEPTILLGDLNVPPWASSRQRIASKLREVHARNRPYVPSPGFRGKSMPYYTPIKWNLDGMYISNHFDIKKSGSKNTRVSDHPLLYAILKLRSKTA